jgi:acetyl esterase/lipase
MKRYRFAISLLLLSGGAPFVSFAGPGPEIPLWPEGVPDEASLDLPAESSADKDNDGIVRVSHVSEPKIRFFPAPEDANTGAAVVVCPGGGYSILAISHEGTQVCEWLNSIGVNAVLLKYRIPRREGLEKHQAPLQDAQRALSLTRKNAANWKIDSKRIGILGFSAGGHLSAVALTNADRPRTYPAKPEIDSFSCRPDFAVLVYPAYLQSEEDPNALAPEIRVTKETSPTFLVVAHGDQKWVESSVVFYLAMKRAGASAELHVHGKGGHGFGMKPIDEEVGNWPRLAEKWMRETGILD